MKNILVQEIINDIIKIDPDLEEIKVELEKLVEELIANKPKAPFSNEFKEALKAQIIGAINEQKILYDEKKRDRKNMLHSLKFWMIGMSSLATCFLVFGLFQYFDTIKEQETYTTRIESTIVPASELQDTQLAKTSDKIQPENSAVQKPTIEKKVKMLSTTQPIEDDSDIYIPVTSKRSIVAYGEDTDGGASEDANNVMMMATPENRMAKEVETTDTKTSNTFCKTSENFLASHNITNGSDVITKTFSYDKSTYIAIINFNTNAISIKNTGVKDTTGEITDINTFFQYNNFNIQSDYNNAIIDETDKILEYYYPSQNKKRQGITVLINKETNVIFSIENICIYQ